ncbi:squalene/phytoene synthase family protein [Chitinasiproducens palmae]|uniref:Farnesyl-diphosphate farnesyltransferase n=1 Tax=Chitinasiproducens palmae TaxID=1770053 RepID=A0A1H2PTM0_9BURK|nr:squalene/phytoene synthase family protein [Chitinasiproducens palmae]SDV50479.1 farnesyl-diphosphate farnesyltransferase [Chitinasiproducens palmae]
MSPDQYCQQKAAPPGSAAYYAILQAPASRRAGLRALLALQRELLDTAESSSDTPVADAKFAWWRGELDAMAAGAPTHPVSRALAAASAPGAHSDAVTALKQLVDAYDNDFHQGRYFDFDALQHYARSTQGAFAACLARASDPMASSEVIAWARGAGLALALAGVVADVGHAARHGRLYLPVDEMQRFNVTAADIASRRYVDGFVPLMRHQAERARESIQQARASIPPAGRRSQRTLLACLGLAEQRLDEIARADFAVLHQRIDVTPVRMLLRAWRSARFA